MGTVSSRRRRSRRMDDVHGTGRGAVRGDSAFGSGQERGDAGRHTAVRGFGHAGDRSAKRNAPGLEHPDRLQEQQLFVHRRPARCVRVARQER